MNKSKRATGVYLWVGLILTILSSSLGFIAIVNRASGGIAVFILILTVVGLCTLATGIYQVGQTVDLLHETLLERQTPPEDPEPPEINPDHVMGL